MGFMDAEELVVTLAPVAVYWAYAGMYEALLARTTALDKYRLHSRRDEETKNIASRKDVVRGVLLQQCIQVAISVAVLKVSIYVAAGAGALSTLLISVHASSHAASLNQGKKNLLSSSPCVCMHHDVETKSGVFP
jgi:hypothetical protein